VTDFTPQKPTETGRQLRTRWIHEGSAAKTCSTSPSDTLHLTKTSRQGLDEGPEAIVHARSAGFHEPLVIAPVTIGSAKMMTSSIASL
jgi:hypothetical protein